MDAYREFLETKRVQARPLGFEPGELHGALFGFQRDIVRWALRLGRAAVFAGCGLGKTLMQLVWAARVACHTGRPVLVLTPLAVGRQTVREAEKFGLPVTLCATQDDVETLWINVTNYEKLHHFDPSAFAGVVLDESSILKSYTGKTKQALIASFAETPYRLACTATPAPNDHMELGNHSQFLGVMDSNEMLTRWFVNDSMETGNYRLKRHAEEDFWRWVSSWAVCLERPSDLGYEDAGFDLPPLELVEDVVRVDLADGAGNGQLFRSESLSATAMHREMRRTAAARAARVAELVAAEPGEPWLIWCNTNYEADEAKKRIPEALEVRGSDPEAAKEKKLDAFSRGEAKVLITKPSIAGFGMNWQHCARVAFLGLSYSFEQAYQAIRRTWRFGQTRPVRAYYVVADTEGEVLRAVREKQAAHERMQVNMVAAMQGGSLHNIEAGRRLRMDVDAAVAEGSGWTLHRGDCVDVVRTLPDNSVGCTVFSPPFSNLYIYSDSYRDMGNTSDDGEFFAHFDFLVPELLRVTKPGRLCLVHCKDLPCYKNRDGAAGLRDFPGAIIRSMERHGWQFHSRCTIWKDPVIEMQRTKTHGLLYKELCKDSCASRQGMADYLLAFRKWEGDEFSDPVAAGAERFDRYSGLKPPDPTEIADECQLSRPLRDARGRWPRWNPFPVGSEAYRQWSIHVWQRYASPVWMDIDQTDVLNCEPGRERNDEKHICPLQLGVIERALLLWSNPGDLVLSPFAGIGSEGYVAVRLGRKFVGSELKDSYWRVAARNLGRAAGEAAAPPTLFDTLAS